MHKQYYAIIGPDSDAENQQYWDADNMNWTEAFCLATQYPRNILCGPLPVGTVGIMQFNEFHNPIGYYQLEILPLLVGEGSHENFN